VFHSTATGGGTGGGGDDNDVMILIVGIGVERSETVMGQWDNLDELI
jgi:hypothetical protein